MHGYLSLTSHLCSSILESQRLLGSSRADFGMSRTTVDLNMSCRHKFVEYSYLRAADKKHEVPEHIEKTVLFLVDASAIALVDPEAQDWGAKASSAKEAEQEAAAAVKAAWHAAKDAKEVSQPTDNSCYACLAAALTLQTVVVLQSIRSRTCFVLCLSEDCTHAHSIVVRPVLMDSIWTPHGPHMDPT